MTESRDAQGREGAALRAALEAVVQHDASHFYGADAEKNRRASWRGVMRKVRAALRATPRSGDGGEG